MRFVLMTLLFFFSSSGFALSFDQDVPAELKSALLSDLDFVYQIKGLRQSPLHQEIFGAVSGSSYRNFFESRITSVGLDSCGTSPSIVACVRPMRDSGKIWITPNFQRAQIPQIARIMTLFHESRHAEARSHFWAHDRCPTPFLDENGHDIIGIVSGQKLEGSAACDSTVYGSYGSSSIMLHNMAKYCTNCSEKIRMDADLWANDQMERIFSSAGKATLKRDFSLEGYLQ